MYLKRVTESSRFIPRFRPYFLAGRKENASISFLKPRAARYIKIVNVAKTIREHVNPVCQFKELASGMKIKTPKSHIMRAAIKL
jgi:hypothetical protein